MSKYVYYLLFFCSFLFPIKLFSQRNVQYLVTKDDPSAICKYWVYLDPLQMDAPFRNSYGLSFNAGIWAMGFVKKTTAFDVSARYGYGTLATLTEASADPAIQAEGSLIYFYSDKTNPRKNTRIILRESKRYSYTMDASIITQKSIVIPAKRRNMHFIRAGAYTKQTPFKTDVNTNSNFKGNIRTAGVFIGIGKLNISNVFIRTNTDGSHARSAIFRLYADFLIAPVRSVYSSNNISVPSTVKPFTGPLGYRIGMFAMPVQRRIKGRSGISVGAEFGSRPGEGLYATTSFMFCLSRR